MNKFLSRCRVAAAGADESAGAMRCDYRRALLLGGETRLEPDERTLGVCGTRARARPRACALPPSSEFAALDAPAADPDEEHEEEV